MNAWQGNRAAIFGTRPDPTWEKIQKAQRQQASRVISTDNLESALRQKIEMRGGASSRLGVFRLMRRDSGSRAINYADFKTGLKNLNINASEEVSTRSSCDDGGEARVPDSNVSSKAPAESRISRLKARLLR